MPSYIKSLDGVRALAIILVLLFHFYYVLEIGWIGVQMFFVLSGYLITNILLNSKEGSDLSFYLKRFYWRRTLRIFPLYYVYLLVVTAIYLLIGVPKVFPNIAGYLYTYTYNLQPLFSELHFDAFFTHFWSLSVEEQFYLVWPLLIFILNGKQVKYAIIALILSIPLFRYFFGEWIMQSHFSEPGEVLYRFTISHFDAFAWGGCIAVFQLDKRVNNSRNLLLVSFAIFLFAGLAHLFTSEQLLPFTSFGYPIGGLGSFQHIWSYILINMFSAALILYLIQHNSDEYLLSRIFRNKVIVEIGKLSYGMYVYHWVLLSLHKKFINPHIGNMVFSFVVYFLLVFLVSYISFYTLESYFLRLKENVFIKKKVA